MTAVRALITRFAPELRQTHQYDRDLRGAVPDAIEGVLSRWETHPGGVRGWRSLGRHRRDDPALHRPPYRVSDRRNEAIRSAGPAPIPEILNY